jgi:hypothetical protein
MRFDDLIKKPAKPQKPLTYTESLQAKLDAEMSAKPTPKFTAVEWAIMEGGGSLEEAPIEERKRKRKKIKNAAYGPGPYGWYGYDASYSGDGGVEESKHSTSYGETFGQASQEKTNIMHKHNIKPGDAEWFKLWFGLPYMTGEKPHEGK